MHKRVDISELKLNRNSNRIYTSNRGEVAYDLKTSIQIPPVVIGELKNKKILENEAISLGNE